MDKYKNVHGILAFSHEGKDFISGKDDTIELPDSSHVKTLVRKGYIVKQKIQKIK